MTRKKKKRRSRADYVDLDQVPFMIRITHRHPSLPPACSCRIGFGDAASQAPNITASALLGCIREYRSTGVIVAKTFETLLGVVLHGERSRRGRHAAWKEPVAAKLYLFAPDNLLYH